MRLLIIFSDTGGGHRAAANALRDAFQRLFPGRYAIELVDGFKEGMPFPANRIPATYYPLTTYAPWLWGFLFHASNTRTIAPLVAALEDLVARRRMTQLLIRRDPDLVVSVHPLLNTTPCRVVKQLKPHAPFVTVVTDLFDAHALWFAAASDLVSVPTEGAYERGRYWGFPVERMRVLGQPISLQFATAPERSPDELREALGLQRGLFTILLVGGGEGMGPLRDIARALDGAQLPLQLIIIAGRNESLRARLLADKWHVPVSIQGFVTNMPDWLHASDLVITKAGPGTIMEALAAGKPMILSGNLPGQEEGNVTFVEKSGVGVLRTSPDAIAAQVREWLAPGNTALAAMRANAVAAARPNAALEIARAIAAVGHQGEVKVGRHL